MLRAELVCSGQSSRLAGAAVAGSYRHRRSKLVTGRGAPPHPAAGGRARVCALRGCFDRDEVARKGRHLGIGKRLRVCAAEERTRRCLQALRGKAWSPRCRHWGSRQASCACVHVSRAGELCGGRVLAVQGGALPCSSLALFSWRCPFHAQRQWSIQAHALSLSLSNTHRQPAQLGGRGAGPPFTQSPWPNTTHAAVVLSSVLSRGSVSCRISGRRQGSNVP